MKSSVVPVAALRSESLTINRGKVTESRQRSNVRDFLLCPGVLHFISYLLQSIEHEAEADDVLVNTSKSL
ncbi:hypothetical protein BJV78DRAFT_1244377 [Lactifluus subvellereus]|nr:hypothetical protein BJV78DRAFT_1244377 [Lactifluus subvellereus]